MHFKAGKSKKWIVLLAALIVLAVGLCATAFAEPTRVGYISALRTLDGEPVAGETTRYKLSIRQSGQVTAKLTDKTTGSVVTVLDQYYGSAQNILLQVPAEYNAEGRSYSLDVQLSRNGMISGSANHSYTIAKPEANISALSVSASFRPAIGEQLNASFTLPYPAQVTAVVKKGGQSIATVAENCAFPAGTSSLTWSGSDYYGKVCSEGQYSFELYCVNEAGTSPVVAAAFQIMGDADKAIGGRVDGAITSFMLPQQPVDGEEPVFYLNCASAGRYTLKLRNMTTGASLKMTGNAQAGLNEIRIASAAIGGHEYRMQLVLQGASSGKAEISYAVHINPPSISVSAPSSLQAGYGAAMPIQYTTGTSGTVVLYIMDESHTQTYAAISLPGMQAGSGVAYWNGKDQAGNMLPSGTYHVVGEAINHIGKIFSHAAEFTYAGKLESLGTPQAAGTIALFAPADDPQPAESTPIRMRLQITSPGTLKIVRRDLSTGKTLTVYNAYASAGIKTVTMPGEYFDAASYELEATLTANRKVTGRAFAYVQPRMVPAKIENFFCSDTFDSKWGEAYEFSFDTASTGYLYVRVERDGQIIRNIKNGQYCTAGHYAYLWDGRDDSKKTVESGNYRISAVYIDKYGNYSNQVVHDLHFARPEYPEGVYGYSIVGLGTHKTPIYIYNKPEGSTIGVTYGISATFKVMEDLGDWLFVETSGTRGGPIQGYVRANRLQKVTVTSPYRIEVCIRKHGTNAQTMFVYKNDELIDQFKISSGMVEGTTPTGTFCLMNRKPYFNVLGTSGICWDTLRVVGGVCIHRIPEINGSYKTTEPLLGTPASHGCVRVPVEKSRWLYEEMPDTTPIIIYTNK